MKVLKFEATWCAPCKSLTKLLESFDTEMYIQKVDIDENVDLVRDYGIRSVPTLVMLDDDGVEVKRGQNFKTLEDIQSFLKV